MNAKLKKIQIIKRGVLHVEDSENIDANLEG